MDECQKVDEERNIDQQAIVEKEQSITAIFDKLDTDSTCELQKLASLCEAINPSRSEISDVSDSTTISFVEMASVSDKGFIAEKIDRPLGDVRKGGYTYFRENDIIIAKITPCMENGKCALAKGLTNGIGMGSSEFHVLRTSERVLPHFIFSYLNRESIRKQAASVMTGASGHRRVPISFYENLQIPILPITNQQRIVDRITQLEGEIKTLQQTIAECPDKKQAILDKYLK